MSQKTGGTLQMKAKQLKKERIKRGLTIKEMALRLNTPEKTYQNWEYGTRRVPGIVEPFLKMDWNLRGSNFYIK